MKPDSDRGLIEVWVVDNASSDGSADMVESEFEWVHLIRSAENLGFGRAVNAVADRTHAPWIAPANADIELVGASVEVMLRAADATVGAVAPRLMLPNGEVQHSVHAFPSIPLALLFALGAYRLPGVGDRLCVEGFWRSDRARLVDWAHGAFLLVRREAWEQVGGFDPRQWMYAEDIDLLWRQRRAGWATRYEPAAEVRHAASAAAIQAFGDARVERHLLATYDWLELRRGALIARAIGALNATGAVARWIAFALLRIGRPARYGDQHRHLSVYLRAHLAGLRGQRPQSSSRPQP